MDICFFLKYICSGDVKTKKMQILSFLLNQLRKYDKSKIITAVNITRRDTMEIDLSIALLIKENWQREQEELKEQEKASYDFKKKISYTVEELIEGIKSGEQYLYKLKMTFEPKAVLTEQWKIPYIIDFFDVVQEEPINLLMASNKRKVSVVMTTVPCEKVEQSVKEWVSQMKSAFKELKLHMKVMDTKAVGKMEYFCYELPTAEGKTYNVQFRYLKEKQLYTGSLNCMLEEKAGMGLMLEAFVHVMEELNR